MGVPTSEVGYTSAMPMREDHEVHKDMWGYWRKKKQFMNCIKVSTWMLIREVVTLESENQIKKYTL